VVRLVPPVARSGGEPNLVRVNRLTTNGKELIPFALSLSKGIGVILF